MKPLSIFLLFLITASAFSQSANNVEKHQFKVNMLNPGVEYEVRLATNQTLDFGAGLQFGARGGEGYFDWVFVPAFNAQYRYYYNFKRRIGKGKTISGNSANYIALANTTFINELLETQHYQVAISVMWPLFMGYSARTPKDSISALRLASDTIMMIFMRVNLGLF